MQNFPQVETTFLLPGEVGNLEVLTLPVREDVAPRSAVAIICHPHPLYGGTMLNKVVSTLARSFRDLGLCTVQFNFRGVGKSEGKFDDGVGELADLLAIVKWVQAVRPHDEIWLSGFSFGAAISAHAATKITAAQLVSIAPPVPRFNLLQLPPVLCPWIVVQGDEDDVVVPADVYAWVETRNPAPKLIRMAGAGHFFHGQLMELRRILLRELT